MQLFSSLAELQGDDRITDASSVIVRYRADTVVYAIASVTLDPQYGHGRYGIFSSAEMEHSMK